MAESLAIPTHLVGLVLVVSCSLCSLGKSVSWTTFSLSKLQTLDLANRLHIDPDSVESASSDYGNIVLQKPAAVLYPSSVEDLRNLIKFSYNSSVPFAIAARGRGHSVRGQAMVDNGVVIDMMHLNRRNRIGVVVSRSPSLGFFADVGGEQLWVNVLNATLEHGLAPVSWTDYLHLSVGGTLSNAGIGGHTFRYGPQISNVFEMDVITGKGHLVTCSPNMNPELFYAVLGGLGQFGIITRARIALEPAPKRVKWVRMLYSDFSAFTNDQERLISVNGWKQNNAVDYLEGSLLMALGPLNNWRSSLFPESDIPTITSLATQHGILYTIEVAKYYDDRTQDTVVKELQEMFNGLSFVPGLIFEKDASYVDFLTRVRSEKDIPHPWLNLFLPKSSISDFNSGVFRDIVLRRNITTGPVLFYPMNRNKWNDKTSAVIPEEDVFYTVGFLHSSGPHDWQIHDGQNMDVIKFCEEKDLGVKQYLAHFTSQEEWIDHFGSKWKTFRERKARFDPKMLLSPGQRIFNNI